MYYLTFNYKYRFKKFKNNLLKKYATSRIFSYHFNKLLFY